MPERDVRRETVKAIDIICEVTGHVGIALTPMPAVATIIELATGIAQQVLNIVQPALVTVVMPKLHLTIELEQPAITVGLAVVPRHYGTHLTVCIKPAQSPGVVLPIAVLIGSLVLAYVVHLGIHRRATLVGKIGRESLGHIFVMGTGAGIEVHAPLGHILLLYLEVNDRSLVGIVYSHEILLLVGLLIHRHILHGIADDV